MKTRKKTGQQAASAPTPTPMFSWVDGAQIKTPASQVGPILMQLTITKGGRLSPADVVAAARTDPVLHLMFTWNNRVAAEKYRRQEAAYILRSLEVDRVLYKTKWITPPVTGKTRYFHNVTRKVVDLEKKATVERKYVTVETVMADPALMLQVINEAISELRAWYIKYSQYTALSRIVQRIGRAGIQQLKNTAGKLSGKKKTGKKAAAPKKPRKPSGKKKRKGGKGHP